ncbi:MAG: hypothetical protein IH591_17315, partial [Bacteroidales bacterium]|nr:hypothetical protein [Bacteroidales bacterium]
NYIWKGREHTLTVQDLAMHFGLEAYDHYLNVTPRDRFLKRVPWSRCFPLDVGYSMNFEHLRIDGTRLVVNNVIYAPDVTPELLARADFFSRDVMKFMSESGLRDGNVRFRNKQSELEKRRAIIDSLSCFDLARLPAEILSSCLDILFPGSQNNLILESPSDADSINRFARPMLFIGWVWANYFTNDDGSFLPGKETFTRDYLDYEEEDGAQVLTYNVELHIIEELVPLLRGIRQLQNI